MPFRLGGALTCTPYYGKCRSKFPDKVRGVRNIDLTKRAFRQFSVDFNGRLSRLELPAAREYETKLKAEKEQKVRESVPQF